MSPAASERAFRVGLIMASDKRTAERVHELLMDARPHADDRNFAEAARLVAFPSPSADREREAVVEAIAKLRASIGQASAADQERDLLHAIHAAACWVKSC
jgi:hypothetical protein